MQSCLPGGPPTPGTQLRSTCPPCCCSSWALTQSNSEQPAAFAVNEARRSFLFHTPRKCVMLKVSVNSSRSRSATQNRDGKDSSKTLSHKNYGCTKICFVLLKGRLHSLCSAKSRQREVKSRICLFIYLAKVCDELKLLGSSSLLRCRLSPVVIRCCSPQYPFILLEINPSMSPRAAL